MMEGWDNETKNHGNIETNTAYSLASTMDMLYSQRIYLKLKRGVDVVASHVGLIVVIIPMIAIAILVGTTSRGGVLYRQKRLGLNGQEFTIYKFRTMVQNADQRFQEFFDEEQLNQFVADYKLENDPRITKIGKMLRKTSLDELPQIFNIIKGDMSVVGPRPVLQSEIAKFGDHVETVLSVRPGLTGYWAVNGRSNTTYDERVDMEVYYARNISLRLDVAVFAKTFQAVVRKDGAK
jgi:lipopolysaccharide/colanic/teichoic acid biosynthesis glycosyltransferase